MYKTTHSQSLDETVKFTLETDTSIEVAGMAPFQEENGENVLSRYKSKSLPGGVKDCRVAKRKLYGLIDSVCGFHQLL